MSCLPFRPPSPEINSTPQTREHTYPPPPPVDGAATSASPPSGWTEYLKRLGKKDASVGVSRTWVKKGRDVDAKEESERDFPSVPQSTNPTLPSRHPSSNPPATTATAPFKLLPAPPPRVPGRRPQESFYLPNDRVPHFAAMLGASGGDRESEA
ncbi:hypothetical protein QFC20_007213 [Naganishia adeliensis]|uniref:Uncharacterized protein n=1 Tax=Naganishia adeliensis TaxID=92952 RepID=A0ACC2V2E8_9TREE|nr:hypothetical protein QFC20_007213 [Naganishia adeliensis]